MAKKQIDRHLDPEQVSFTFLIRSDYLQEISKAAKKSEITRGAVLREAVREWIERRSA